ncbi:MAG: DUF3592 domain-containing protein [Clostridiales bacterium]|nr:DUF3592 domain-containing protein [Clostridiales bacterium]
MNPENKFARFMRNSGPARVFVPMGLILLVFGILMLTLFGGSGKLEKTVGRIVSVTEGTIDTENNDQLYDVKLAYTVDGKEYEGVFADMAGDYKVGDEMDIYYDPEAPEKISNTKAGGFIAPILIAAGAALAGFGIYKTVKAFKKSKELDAGDPFPTDECMALKTAPGATEYYFRFDGNSFKPGYLIEDADRNVLFEGKMLKNSLVGARTFEFNDHTTGSVAEHDVGHVVTQAFNDEVFSASSWFKFDGEKIWDVLHGMGVRLRTDMRSKFPYMSYNAAKDGAAFARIESTSVYVHEDEEAEHRIKIPVGKMYYRIWSPSKDLETLFLTVFAITESEQTVVE